VTRNLIPTYPPSPIPPISFLLSYHQYHIPTSPVFYSILLATMHVPCILRYMPVHRSGTPPMVGCTYFKVGEKSECNLDVLETEVVGERGWVGLVLDWHFVCCLK
jgi:hypothetical protein